MLHSRGRDVRQLGVIRHSASSFPPNPSSSKLDRDYEGISGNAIHVSPPPKLPSEILKKLPDVPAMTLPKKSSQFDSAPKAEKKVVKEINPESKKLKEALEHGKEMEKQIASLLQLVESLRQELEEKDQLISDLNDQLQAQNEKSRLELEEEQTSHQTTKENLETVSRKLEERKMFEEELKLQHANQMMTLSNALKKSQSDLTELQISKDKEIALRDERIERLKKQMAGALEGNSKERHYQLEELSKELTRVQEEAESLRIKLKNSQKQSKMNCGNCERLNEKLSAAAKEGEKLRNELIEQISASRKQSDGVQTKTTTKNPSKF